MGIAISYISIPYIYIINKFTKLHQSIDGNWFTYLSLLYQLFLKRKFSKGKFELHNPEVDGNPEAIGLLPFKEEWDFECPNRNKAENIFIYGTNTWGQYLLINIKWRPQMNNKINAFVDLILKDQNVYEMHENHSFEIKSNSTLKEYKIGGLTIEVLEPLRKLRIKVRGYLRRRDTNQLIYCKFGLFWSALSNVFDFQNDFDDQFIAKELSSLGISSVKSEERHEQWGQIVGRIELENEESKQIYLWGNKAKHYPNNEKRKITRIYGFCTKSFAFHFGASNIDNIRSRYGYLSFGTGCVYPISSISLSFNELENIGNSLTKFTADVNSQNRNFEFEIEESEQKYNDISICNLKLNGHKGKCVIVYESNDEEIIYNQFSENKSENVIKDLVLSISDPKSQSVLYSGGKGASLGTLFQLSNNSEAKFVVPRGMIVTTNSYETLIIGSMLLQNEIEKLEKIVWSESRNGMKESCDHFVQKFAKQDLPEIIVNQIKESLISIFGDNFDSIVFAIRSSASGEDSEEMSAAGQMTTFLGVKGIDEISRAIMKCWSSQFSFVAVEYKRGYGQEINSPMAVVIQEMVNCDSAGVIFTCDPLTGDERKLIITGNYGIGESVVSAMAEPDTIRLDVNIEANSLLKQRTIKGIESIQIGSKLKSIKLSDINVETVIEDEHKSKVCCLTEEEMLKLGSIALNVHKFYGNARDIEWGIKDKQIYLLQSRPITNLDNTFNEWEIMHDIDTGQPSEREYFSRANFGEIFPGASSYICLSWLSQIWMVAGIRAFKSMFNMVSKDFSPFYNFGCGVVSNQLFMAIKNGNPPFSLDPNSKITKGMQMAFFGHEFQDEELFNDSKDRKPKRPVSTSSKLSSAKIFMGIMFLAKKKLLKRRNSILAFDLLKDRNFNTSKELLDHILSNSEFMYLAIQTHSIASIYSMMNNMILMNLLSGNGKSNQNKDILFDFALLLSSSNDVVSAEVPNALRDIAVSIEYPEEFCSKSIDEALDYLKNGNNECNKRFKEFLTKHGHRGYKEFDVLVQQWAENPIPVVKSLQSMLMNGSSNLNPKEDKSLNEIISLIRTPISRTKKFLLKNFILPRCRDGVGLREQGKYLYIWTVNVYRHAFWRLSQMMVKEGRLPENDLLFYLYIHELEKLVNERDPVLVLRAKSRKRFHDKKDKLLFSEIVIGPIMRPRNDITVNNLENTEGLPKIKGTPVCFGKVKARACVAVNIDGAKDIQSGDILITYSTDIGWSPYFPMLSGLATEIGGLISHGAVIAREYGLPCLIGVEGASNLFKTGDIVLLDSESGEIIKLESD